MTEHEILIQMYEHVRANRKSAPAVSGPKPSSGGAASIMDLLRMLDQLSALQASVGAINPRSPGLANSAVQAFKKSIQRSLSWYTRSLQDVHAAIGHVFEQQILELAALSDRLEELENQRDVRVLEKEVQRLKEAVERLTNSPPADTRE